MSDSEDDEIPLAQLQKRKKECPTVTYHCLDPEDKKLIRPVVIKSTAAHKTKTISREVAMSDSEDDEIPLAQLQKRKKECPTVTYRCVDSEDEELGRPVVIKSTAVHKKKKRTTEPTSTLKKKHTSSVTTSFDDFMKRCITKIAQCIVSGPGETPACLEFLECVVSKAALPKTHNHYVYNFYQKLKKSKKTVELILNFYDRYRKGDASTIEAVVSVIKDPRTGASEEREKKRSACLAMDIFNSSETEESKKIKALGQRLSASDMGIKQRIGVSGEPVTLEMALGRAFL